MSALKTACSFKINNTLGNTIVICHENKVQSVYGSIDKLCLQSTVGSLHSGRLNFILTC